ncbi:MAG: hypothetical protein RLZ45_687 [Verrucomicrobiota bacterium]|jgi:hypothetical protein
MIPESKIQEVWAAARRAPSSVRVPYAFEHRVMAAVRKSTVRETAGSAVAGLWKAALVSVAVAVLSTGLDLAVQDPVGEADVEDTLELALLPVEEVESEL